MEIRINIKTDPTFLFNVIIIIIISGSSSNISVITSH